METILKNTNANSMSLLYILGYGSALQYSNINHAYLKLASTCSEMGGTKRVILIYDADPYVEGIEDVGALMKLMRNIGYTVYGLLHGTATITNTDGCKIYYEDPKYAHISNVICWNDDRGWGGHDENFQPIGATKAFLEYVQYPEKLYDIMVIKLGGGVIAEQGFNICSAHGFNVLDIPCDPKYPPKE